MQLDYSLTDPQARIDLVNKIIADTPQYELTNQYLQYLTNYILFVYDKGQTKKEKQNESGVLTRNRSTTINKRETSFEGLISSLENGEDGIYNLISNDKNQILDHRDKITIQEIEENETLKNYYNTIKDCENKLKTAHGKRKYILKKQIIEIWQMMYLIKASINGIPTRSSISKNQIKTMAHMTLDEKITLNENGIPQSSNPISLFNADCVSLLLCHYSRLKEESMDDFQSDMRFMLLDLENAVDAALENEPILYDLLVWKIDGCTNEEIVRLMEENHNVNHTEQYYSTLWRKRIPKLIVEQVQKDYLYWYYTNVEYGNWKKCNKCGETKLAHPIFFSKNTSKDGFYSVCKTCRAKK